MALLAVDEYIPTEAPLGERWQEAAPPHPGGGVALLAEFASGVQSFERFSQETTEGTRRLVNDVKAHPPENLDAIIDGLQEIEERNAQRVRPILESFARIRRSSSRDPDSHYRLKALTLIGRQEQAIVDAAEALRDARWELMVFRAGIEDQEGEIFDNPEDLSRLLDTL